ncbi:HAD family hydrolase [Myxococcus sp. CA051A]|uniref:HAD family hydrolase n=1 Tax=Myxococcus sp. CA051A TaxID=2741739 RepID=UPI00157AB22C|nr:HAD family hydrolase [Myxococcus sp. CA051A]NTX64316.1 HAD family hydrolase [Myxococcus sp. CA051A]
MKLVITDLDNTLYDWVSFFSKAFEAMAVELSVILNIDAATLFNEFQAVHQKYGDSEYPFAVLDLPTLQRQLGSLSREEKIRCLDKAFHAFNSSRHKELQLYDGVELTLMKLRQLGIPVIGHTEALAVNAVFRLEKLGIFPLFRRLYALEPAIPLPPTREMLVLESSGVVQSIPRSERKPNPRLLVDICEREGVPPSEVLYVGDSLSRDILMAKSAGVTAVWAEYGTRYSPSLWSTLVKITHWTNEDIARDTQLRRDARQVRPDRTIQNFSEVLGIL